MADVDLPGLDSSITQLPSDIREDLAERGRNDLYFFAKAILGNRDMAPGAHMPLCVFLDENKSRFKLVLMPRGHFKTTVVTVGRSLQRVVRDPESRSLILNEITKNTERWLESIRSHAESNKVFRALYSSVIPKDTRKVRWNASEVDFVRQGHYPEPTIDTIGMTGAITSRHFTHITVDDPISEEAAKSEKVMNDAISRLSKIIPLMVKPNIDTLDIVGTRWSFHDVYSFFMKSYGSKLAIFKRAAIEEGKLIFPELISLETLAQARQDLGEYAFSCLYMNNPRNAEVQDFNINDVKFFAFTPDFKSVILYNRSGDEERRYRLDQLDVTCTLDPAPAEKITSDRNALVTVGVTPCNRALVLDVFAERCSPIKVIEHMFFVNLVFHPRAFGIEGVAYQKAFKYFLAAECARRGEYMNIQELTAQGQKVARIRGLQPLAATGRLYVLPTEHILRNELSEFPLSRHDDAVDALSMHLQLFRGQMSAARWAKYKASEASIIAQTGDYGNVPLGLIGPSSERRGLLLGAGSDYDNDDDLPYQPQIITHWTD